MIHRPTIWQTFVAAVLTFSASVPAIAQDDEAAGTHDPLSLEYVPDDALAVIAARPREMLAQPLFAPLHKALREDKQLNALVDLSVMDDVAQVVIAILRGENNGIVHSDGAAMVLHFVKDIEPDVLAARWLRQPRKADFGGQTYFMSKGHQHVCFFPDERMAVLCDCEESLHRVVSGGRRGAAESNLAVSWATVSGRDAAAFLDISQLRTGLDNEYPGQLQKDALPALWQQGRHIVCSATSGDELKLELTVICQNRAATGRVSLALVSGLRDVSKALAAQREAVTTVKDRRLSFLPRLLDLTIELAASAASETTSNSARLRMRLSQDAGERIAVLAPAVSFVLMEARRSEAVNNVRLIGIALFNYHDAHGRFPPAVVMGPDGKTPHSWRVEILPFLGYKKLYDNYRMNESWDSEHNRKLLDQIPPVYRCPGDDGDSINASYFAMVGKGTLFEGDEGIRIRDVTDGPSNVLWLVDSKRDVPWTKPEDIPVDVTKDLPEFGGHFDGEFIGLLGDGSADFFPKNIDAEILKLLIQRNDGRPIPNF